MEVDPQSRIYERYKIDRVVPCVEQAYHRNKNAEIEAWPAGPEEEHATLAPDEGDLEEEAELYDYASGRLGCWMPAGREIDHAMRDAAEDFGSEREDDEEMEDARSEYSEDSRASVVSSGSAVSVATTGTTASASSTTPATGQNRIRMTRRRQVANMEWERLPALPAIDE